MSLVTTLTNKHLVVALIVAPILAVLAWFAVGEFAGDEVLTPASAEPGEAYPLIERSGCRYAGGECRLSNEDFELKFSLSAQGSVTVYSAVPLESLLLGLRSNGDAQPRLAQPLSAERDRWSLPLSSMPNPEDALRVVAVTAGSAYFGEASLVFTQAPADVP